MRLKSVLALALAMAACDPGQPDSSNGSVAAPAAPGEAGAGRLDRTRAGRAAPDVTFRDPEGNPASLADFRGKPVLLNLWATWCAPCVAEMPTLDALAAREGDKLEVLTISQDLDGRDKVEAFFKERGYKNLETWLDPRMALMSDLKVSTLPTTVLYDAQGREVWRMTGIEEWTSPRAAELIAEAGAVSPAAAR